MKESQQQKKNSYNYLFTIWFYIIVKPLIKDDRRKETKKQTYSSILFFSYLFFSFQSLLNTYFSRFFFQLLFSAHFKWLYFLR